MSNHLKLGSLTSPLVAALCAVGLVSIGSPAPAGFVDFNPTGSAASPTISVAGIDLAVGNALAVGSLPLTVGKTFQLDYQAATSGVLPKGVTSAPAGLGTAYQITAVASFTEIVTAVDAATGAATFATAPTQRANSFFQLYYSQSVIANSVTGTGYNQGTLMLAGTPSVISPSVGVFSLSTAQGVPLIQSFDQFGGLNHYPTVASVVGSGSALVTADVTYVNPDFFKTAISQISFNSSLVTSFQQTSPSALFLGKAGTDAPTVVPNIGTMNGVNGTDFQFQADANFSFIPAAVPEPASLVQSGLGMLIASGVVGWLRSRGRGLRTPA